MPLVALHRMPTRTQPSPSTHTRARATNARTNERTREGGREGREGSNAPMSLPLEVLDDFEGLKGVVEALLALEDGKLHFHELVGRNLAHDLTFHVVKGRHGLLPRHRLAVEEADHHVHVLLWHHRITEPDLGELGRRKSIDEFRLFGRCVRRCRHGEV